MTTARRLLALSLLALMCTGCAANKVWTTSYSNLPNDMTERMDYFPAGEYPMFIVAHCRGKTAALDVINRSTGERVGGRVEQRIPEELHYTEFPGRLSGGSYVVQLRVEGRLVDSWPFDLAREREVNQPPLARREDQLDPELDELKRKWLLLPDDIKQAIMTMVRTTRTDR